MNPVVVRELGMVAYGPTLQAMRELADRVRRGQQPGEVWLLEHEPVFTAGRAATAVEREAVGAVAVERGGQVTYHGPGQLVVYPIHALPERDLHRWLRRLEALGGAACRHFDLQPAPSDDGTGVFVGQAKLGSIGVAVRGWVNLHGLALNVDMDLAPFARCRPCGLDPARMTDLSRLCDRRVDIAQVAAVVRANLHLLGATER